MASENGASGQNDEQKMQRLNLLATLAGMAAVSFFLAALIVVVFFPPLPPAGAPPASPTPTLTPTPTPTLTPTPTPSPPTATPEPLVELISVEYLQPGVGCQVDVTVNVHGEALVGVFRVWNASYDDPAGSVFEVESLPPGSSSGHLLTLGGNQPAFYAHEIWFEYQGGLSNRLTGLACPGLTPAP